MFYIPTKQKTFVSSLDTKGSYRPVKQKTLVSYLESLDHFHRKHFEGTGKGGATPGPVLLRTMRCRLSRETEVTRSVQGAGSTQSVVCARSGPVLIYGAARPSAAPVSLPSASELPPGGFLAHRWACRTMSPVCLQHGHVVELNHGWSCCGTSPVELSARDSTAADTGGSWRSQ